MGASASASTRSKPARPTSSLPPSHQPPPPSDPPTLRLPTPDPQLQANLEKVGRIVTRLRNETSELVLNSASYVEDCEFLNDQMQLENNVKKHMVYKCIDGQLPEILDQLWDEIIRKFYELKASYPEGTANDDLWSSYENDHPYMSTALSNLDSCLVVFLNGSDVRDDNMLIDKIYFTTIELVCKILSAEAMTPPLYSDSYETAHSCITIAHNFCHNGDWHIPEMRRLDLLTVLERFIAQTGTKDNVIDIKTDSLIVASYLLTEEEKKSSLTVDNKTIKFLVDRLKEIMSADLDDGYRADEMMNGLNNIATIDANKLKLIVAKILPLYVKAMKSESEEMQVKGTQGIWTLSFKEEARKRIENEPDCMTELRRLKDSKNEKVRKAVAGALWQMEGKTKHIEELAGEGDQQQKRAKQHLMISYNWAVQKEVLQFKERLAQAGFRVWIDVEKMRGHTLEAMASAVENASVFIPVMTEKYKNSTACRQEAEYANRLGKTVLPILLQPKYKADGWLGFMLGSILYYDLTKRERYEDTLHVFLQELNRNCDDASRATKDDIVQEDEVDNSVSSAPQQQTAHPQSQNMITSAAILNVKQLHCHRWSTTDVQKWMKSNNMSNFAKKMGDMNGLELAELVRMYHHHPETYYKYMNEGIKLPLPETLKLSSGLQQLSET